MSDEVTPNETPDEKVKRLQAEMINSAADGVQSFSVDGQSVQNMTAQDRKLTIDEAKKAALKNFPIAFFKWR